MSNCEEQILNISADEIPRRKRGKPKLILTPEQEQLKQEQKKQYFREYYKNNKEKMTQNVIKYINKRKQREKEELAEYRKIKEILSKKGI